LESNRVYDTMADMADQARYIHLKEIFVDFIKRRPTSVLELVFKDHAGVKLKSDKFKQGDLVHWNLDTYIRAHTSGTLTIRRALFNISVAEISVEFTPNEFGDDRVVALEDSNHRVTVNFVCGRSQSLADGTSSYALGPQTRTTALTSRVTRSLKLPQVAALPPPTFEQGYDVAYYAAIHFLNDDILLDIFNWYRLDERDWNNRLRWCKLSQVCQRWRCLIYESTFHLGMHIHCTNGTPIVDTLDHIPPLQLRVDYSNTLTRQDELGICQALRLHDRVRYLYLDLEPSILHKCLMLMVEHFPILEDLTLTSVVNSLIPLTLSKAFLAPNLRRLSLSGISLPKRLRLLTSTISLVTLKLWAIQASSYFRPRLLVARLRSLPQLEKLHIGFSAPIPRPSTKRELLGEQGTPVTLPSLKTLMFKGVSVYLESFIAQIRAPVLKWLDITFFNQIAFSLQHLSHFINITEGLNIPVVKVFFRDNAIYVTTSNSGLFDGSFVIQVKCKPLDWQIDCAAQICTALAPALLVSDVGQFILDDYDHMSPAKWADAEIDETTLRELLSSFVGVKELRIKTALLEEIARALQMDEVGSDPGFLLDLQEIVAERNLFASFIDTRLVVGRPVRFSPPSPPSVYSRRSNNTTRIL